MTMTTSDVHAGCGRPWSIHKGGSRLGTCPGSGGALKRDGAVRKAADAPTFDQVQAASDLETWLTPALQALTQIVWSALYPGDDAEITVEQRLAAVAVSCDELKEQLVLKVGEAIGGSAASTVRKADDQALWGLL